MKLCTHCERYIQEGERLCPFCYGSSSRGETTPATRTRGQSGAVASKVSPDVPRTEAEGAQFRGTSKN